MSEQPSPNKKVSTSQVRSLAIIWVVLTVLVGVGTFFGLFWALGGLDGSDADIKTSSEIVTDASTLPVDSVSANDVASDDTKAIAEPADTAQVELEPTFTETAIDIPVTPSPEVVPSDDLFHTKAWVPDKVGNAAAIRWVHCANIDDNTSAMDRTRNATLLFT